MYLNDTHPRSAPQEPTKNQINNNDKNKPEFKRVFEKTILNIVQLNLINKPIQEHKSG